MEANFLTRKLPTKTVYIVFGCLLLIGCILIQELSSQVHSGPGNSAQNNLGQIAKAYIAFSIDGGKPRQLLAASGDTAHSAAVLLAEETGLNDASLYYLKNDPLAPTQWPKTVLVKMGSPGSPPVPNPDFMNSVLSVEIAANISPDAPPTSTPIAWTRGLRENGRWAPDSPWGGGGYIAYLDGHVEWVDKLSLDPNGVSLVKYGTNLPTVNIREALPPGAVILSAEPTKKTP